MKSVICLVNVNRHKTCKMIDKEGISAQYRKLVDNSCLTFPFLCFTHIAVQPEVKD
jgi:hypothetical protein